jgi:hypothetical protein
MFDVGSSSQHFTSMSIFRTESVCAVFQTLLCYVRVRDLLFYHVQSCSGSSAFTRFFYLSHLRRVLPFGHGSDQFHGLLYCLHILPFSFTSSPSACFNHLCNHNSFCFVISESFFGCLSCRAVDNNISSSFRK